MSRLVCSCIYLSCSPNLVSFRSVHPEQLVDKEPHVSQEPPGRYRFFRKLQATMTKLESMSKLIRANMASSKRTVGTLLPKAGNNTARITVKIIRPNSTPKASFALLPMFIQKCAFRAVLFMIMFQLDFSSHEHHLLSHSAIPNMAWILHCYSIRAYSSNMCSYWHKLSLTIMFTS